MRPGVTWGIGVLPHRLRSPVFILAFFVLALALLPAACWWGGGWPSASSPVGLWCGVLAGAIVLFEMLLWLKKWQRGRWRTRRPLGFFASIAALALLTAAAWAADRWGVLPAWPEWWPWLLTAACALAGLTLSALWWFSARAWMMLHIWLGLLAIPLVIIHSGLHFPGFLNARASTIPSASVGELPTSVALANVSGWTLALFLAVSASGVWGLLMQSWLPRRLRDFVPDETVSAAGDEVMRRHVEEAQSLVDALTAPAGPLPPGQPPGRVRPLAPGPLVGRLTDFFARQIRPYLEHGPASESQLRSPDRAARLFAQLAGEVPEHAQEHVRRLESFCQSRRQLDRQRRLERWLHVWQLAHVPLSWALLVLLGWHAVAALKLW